MNYLSLNLFSFVKQTTLLKTINMVNFINLFLQQQEFTIKI